MHKLCPTNISPPFGAYVHGVALEPGARLLKTSGQLGLGADGKVPEGVEAQADICFTNISAILSEGGMSIGDVFHLSAFVTDRAHMAGYMAARDRFLNGAEIASTLVIVSGFTRPEFVVEVEAWAAQ